MAKTVYFWYSLASTVCVSICLLLSLGTLIISSYDLVKFLDKSNAEQKLKHEMSLVAQVDTYGYTDKRGRHYKLPDSYKNDNETKISMAVETSGEPETFKIVVLASFIGGIILGFVQLIGHSLVLFSCGSKIDIVRRLKAWLLFSGCVLIVGLIILLVPFSLHPETGRTLSFSEFSGYFRQKLKSLNEIWSAELWLETLYFCVFGANIVWLAISLLMLSIIMPFGIQPYDSVSTT